MHLIQNLLKFLVISICLFCVNLGGARKLSFSRRREGLPRPSILPIKWPACEEDLLMEQGQILRVVSEAQVAYL